MPKKHFTSDAARVFMESSEDFFSQKNANTSEKPQKKTIKPAPKSTPKKDTATKEPQSRLSIYVPKSYHLQLKKEAVAHDMTISDYVISLIEKGRKD